MTSAMAYFDFYTSSKFNFNGLDFNVYMDNIVYSTYGPYPITTKIKSLIRVFIYFRL